MTTRASPMLNRGPLCTSLCAANGLDNGSAGSGGLRADKQAKTAKPQVCLDVCRKVDRRIT
eukprot:3775070-Alexandrium_andersonii.AAC.1